ncbi:MAG: hypothetical protein U0694_15755 [Anaerolineae bacterium]
MPHWQHIQRATCRVPPVPLQQTNAPLCDEVIEDGANVLAAQVFIAVEHDDQRRRFRARRLIEPDAALAACQKERMLQRVLAEGTMRNVGARTDEREQQRAGMSRCG